MRGPEGAPVQQCTGATRQLTGPQVAADQQVMARGCGGQPRPPIPAVPFRSLPGGADLPAAGVLQQRPDGLRAGERHPAGQREAETGRHPQHVSLAAAFQEDAQPGAITVDLIPAREVQLHAVRERIRHDDDGQPIAANVSQAARFSSRWVRSGVRSPARRAIVQPFHLGRPLLTAPTYFRLAATAPPAIDRQQRLVSHVRNWPLTWVVGPTAKLAGQRVWLVVVADPALSGLISQLGALLGLWV